MSDSSKLKGWGLSCPLSVSGIIISGILILSLFTNIAFAESIRNEHKVNTKRTSIKKDFKDLKDPTDDKSVKIITITKSRMLAILYIISIQVCAGREKIYSPELELKSDRESLTVKLAGLIMPKSCKTNDFFIRANDPASISVSFLAR